MLKCHIKTMALWACLMALAAVVCNAAAGWAYFEAVAPAVIAAVVVAILLNEEGRYDDESKRGCGLDKFESRSDRLAEFSKYGFRTQ